jgi:ADP-heptose:LPS heptosyltransferase
MPPLFFSLSSQMQTPKKILMIRLSSFGDVVLSSVALEVDHIQSSTIDFLTTKEFAPIFKSHPKVRKVWIYERSSGLSGWKSVCRQAWNENYDAVIDLHQSLRTRIARFWFFMWGSRKSLTWRSLSKQRWRHWGYYTFKKFWPKALRPTPVIERMARCAFGTGNERTNLAHLIQKDFKGIEGHPYICVMPSSAWSGKIWEPEKFRDVITKSKMKAVILGKPGDVASQRLQVLLEQSGVDYVNGIGKWSIQETATVLARSKGYFGNDTGFAHLAEAVGVPAYTVYGPTSPDAGFGAWRENSKSFYTDLWCRPCGKDGRFCFRPTNKFYCLTNLSSDTVHLPYEKTND